MGLSVDFPRREPRLVTDPSHAGVLAELMAREPIFHRPEFGTKRPALEAMTEPDFWEVGASGRRYSREYVITTVERRYAHRDDQALQARDFHCQQLAPDLYLLTYTLAQDEKRLTRRATIWRRHRSDWKIVYHQGTVVEDT
jgi:hypothetical protein